MGSEGSLQDPEYGDENSDWISHYNEEPLEQLKDSNDIQLN